jgi:hypothetical protein
MKKFWSKPVLKILSIAFTSAIKDVFGPDGQVKAS